MPELHDIIPGAFGKLEGHGKIFGTRIRKYTDRRHDCMDYKITKKSPSVDRNKI